MRNYPKTTYRTLSAEQMEKIGEISSAYTHNDFIDYLKSNFDITISKPTLTKLFTKGQVSPSIYKKLIKAGILKDPLDNSETENK